MRKRGVRPVPLLSGGVGRHFRSKRWRFAPDSPRQTAYYPHAPLIYAGLFNRRGAPQGMPLANSFPFTPFLAVAWLYMVLPHVFHHGHIVRLKAYTAHNDAITFYKSLSKRSGSSVSAHGCRGWPARIRRIVPRSCQRWTPTHKTPGGRGAQCDAPFRWPVACGWHCPSPHHAP